MDIFFLHDCSSVQSNADPRPPPDLSCDPDMLVQEVNVSIRRFINQDLNIQE